MPYFITNKAQGCSGWATIKGDGEVMGCHTTKSAAIAQMVAISLAEGMEPGGERALNNELEVGDFVVWDNAGKQMFGLVTNISHYGVVTSQIGATMLATQERPLATIVVFEMQDNALIETDQYIVKDFAPLTKVGEIEDAYDQPDDQPHDEPMGHEGEMPHDETQDDEMQERIASGPLAVIVDIDDTLIHMGEPMERVIDYVNALDGRKLIITGRMEAMREETVAQLRSADVNYTALFMKDSDEPTPAFKRKVAERLLNRYNITLAIDNDEANRRAFSSLGIETLNPANIDENDMEDRAAPGTLKEGDFVSWNSSGGRARGRIEYVMTEGNLGVPDSEFVINATEQDPAALIRIWRNNNGEWEETEVLVGHRFSTLTKIQPLNARNSERAINQEAPAFMRAAARRGLEYYADGKGGDGLVDRTIREARLMAQGQVSDDKWIRVAAWIARHLGDLDSPNANPSSDNYPSPGVVAHLLWGSGPSKRQAQRALAYAERVVERIRAEEQNARWSSVSINLNKDDRSPVSKKVERRVSHVEFDVRELDTSKDKMTFRGYAAVFNSPSQPLPFTEYIREGAFARSLKSRNEIKMFKNHNTDIVLGSTRAGTLRLVEDSRGLLAEADLPPTTDGKDLSILMQRGDVNSMSFGFSVPPKGDSWSDDGQTRELREIRLHEVSIVTGFPAYEATTATVRTVDFLATRTQVDADALADALTRLEAGEQLDAQHADLIGEVVSKLRKDAPVSDAQAQADLLELKRKQLDLMAKVF